MVTIQLLLTRHFLTTKIHHWAIVWWTIDVLGPPRLSRMSRLCCFISCRFLDAVVVNLTLHTSDARQGKIFSELWTPSMWTASRCLQANFLGHSYMSEKCSTINFWPLQWSRSWELEKHMMLLISPNRSAVATAYLIFIALHKIEALESSEETKRFMKNPHKWNNCRKRIVSTRERRSNLWTLNYQLECNCFLKLFHTFCSGLASHGKILPS